MNILRFLQSMLRNYPTNKVSSAPATGSVFYEFMMNHLKIPAASSHNIWYSGLESQLSRPDLYAFRGDIPTGKNLELVALQGDPIQDRMHIFTGEESYVQVSDLSDSARTELAIPANARPRDKVYNSNFKAYDEISEMSRYSNELAALAVAKSISDFWASRKANYSERDVLDLLKGSFDNLSGPEMSFISHGNHLAWASLAYMREKGNVSGDIMTEFYLQNPTDFYTKDIGTALPAMFFALASLGEDPVIYYEKLDVKIDGAKDAALYMRQFIPKK